MDLNNINKKIVLEAIHTAYEWSFNGHKLFDYLPDYDTIETHEDAKREIKKIIEMLDDSHSQYLCKRVKRKKNKKTGDRNKRKPRMKKYREHNIIKITIPGHICYGGIFSQDEANTFANTVLEMVRHAIAKNPKGIIIDLRNNKGGSPIHIMGGILPLLNDGEIIKVFPKQGAQYLVKKDNEIKWQDKKMSTKQFKETTEYNGPIAVLISPDTASSAEVLALALKNTSQTRVRLFGETTKGLLSHLDTFILSDGSHLYLKTSLISDFIGIEHKSEKVYPHEKTHLPIKDACHWIDTWESESVNTVSGKKCKNNWQPLA